MKTRLARAQRALLTSSSQRVPTPHLAPAPPSVSPCHACVSGAQMSHVFRQLLPRFADGETMYGATIMIMISGATLEPVAARTGATLTLCCPRPWPRYLSDSFAFPVPASKRMPVDPRCEDPSDEPRLMLSTLPARVAAKREAERKGVGKLQH